MYLTIYGKSVPVPDTIDKLYHSDTGFKEEFDAMVKRIIYTVKDKYVQNSSSHNSKDFSESFFDELMKYKK